jgi:hypothetical protein
MAFGFGYYGIGVLATIICIIIPRAPHLHPGSPEALTHKKEVPTKKKSK